MSNKELSVSALDIPDILQLNQKERIEASKKMANLQILKEVEKNSKKYVKFHDKVTIITNSSFPFSNEHIQNGIQDKSNVGMQRDSESNGINELINDLVIREMFGVDIYIEEECYSRIKKFGCLLIFFSFCLLVFLLLLLLALINQPYYFYVTSS